MDALDEFYDDAGLVLDFCISFSDFRLPVI